MWVVIGFSVAVLLGVGVALLIDARGSAREEPLPWNIIDLARLQASIMAVLGSVSITGIVLVIGFLSSRSADPASIEMNTLAVMFSIAFGYFVQTAFTLSYLPDRVAVGEPLFRLYYSLASTLQFRTVMLLVFALMDFVDFFELALAADVIAVFVSIFLVGVFLIIAVVADSLGLIRFGECYVAAVAGMLLGGLFYAAMRWLAVDSAYAQMTAALVFAGVNGLSARHARVLRRLQ